jgi:hypothetical protein
MWPPKASWTPPQFLGSADAHRVGGCGKKSTVPNKIWLPSIVELLRDEGEKSFESMNPTSKIPTVGAN